MIFYQAPPPDLSVGDPAPDVVFQRSDCTLLRLSSLKGKIVVLEFTSYNCAPCHTVTPKLEELAAKNPDVVFLTISTDHPDLLPKLKAMRGKGAKTKPVQDIYNKDRSKMAVWKFQDTGVPGMFVIDAKGKLASRLILGDEELPRVSDRIDWARHSKKSIR